MPVDVDVVEIAAAGVRTTLAISLGATLEVSTLGRVGKGLGWDMREGRGGGRGFGADMAGLGIDGFCTGSFWVGAFASAGGAGAGAGAGVGVGDKLVAENKGD